MPNPITVNIGDRYEMLVISEILPSDKKNGRMMKCKCDCGGEKIFPLTYLRSGDALSCGCSSRRTNAGTKPGDVFGELTVVRQLEKKECRSFVFECMCSCGNITNVSGASLRKGNTKSCGCLLSKSHTTHGMYDTRIYNIWMGMKQRCLNQNSKDYQNYGGRGISICNEWADSFQSFYDDMSPSYKDHLTIDRIDNNGNYCKENCKWSTIREQSLNRRTNHYVVIDGCNISLSEISMMFDMPTSTVYHKITGR